MLLEDITLHACERFAERAMCLPKGTRLNRAQSTPIAQRIISLLEEYHPIHDGIDAGSFTIKDQEIIIVKEDGRVVTVKEYISIPDPAFQGGMRRQLKNKRRDEAREKGHRFIPKEF